MRYLDFLAGVHRRLAPSAYLEIGVWHGTSLALANCRAIGIDPAYAISAQLDGDVALFRTTSDEYFARPDPLAATRGVSFDLSFIDGLHLFEYALRDFIYAERYSSTRGVIIFDDVLPRSVDEAARQRHTRGWTGDVFRVLQVLERFRPDLIALPLDTRPTGLLAVVGLDSANTVLTDEFGDILAEFRSADPQLVPLELLDRLNMVPPTQFLESGVLELLGGLPPDTSAHEIAGPLRSAIAERLGTGFLQPAGT